jgi:hypothetical protein
MEFYPITIEEMRSAFSKSNGTGKKWTETVVGNEIAFDFAYTEKAIIRVFTAIRNDSQESRTKGKDCIRVVSFIVGGKGLVRSMRVLRVKGWHDNLKKAISTVAKLTKERI